MKVEAGNGVIWVYPYVEPEGEPGPNTEYIAIYPNKTIQLVRLHTTRMSAKAAHTLAEALLHAAELAENSKKSRFVLGNLYEP